MPIAETNPTPEPLGFHLPLSEYPLWHIPETTQHKYQRMVPVPFRFL